MAHDTRAPGKHFLRVLSLHGAHKLDRRTTRRQPVKRSHFSGVPLKSVAHVPGVKLTSPSSSGSAASMLNFTSASRAASRWGSTTGTNMAKSSPSARHRFPHAGATCSKMNCSWLSSPWPFPRRSFRERQRVGGKEGAAAGGSFSRSRFVTGEIDRSVSGTKSFASVLLSLDCAKCGKGDLAITLLASDSAYGKQVARRPRFVSGQKRRFLP